MAALERLADPGDDGSFTLDPITKAYRKLLEVERNKDVRKCILGVMPIVRGSTIQVGKCRGDNISNAAFGPIPWLRLMSIQKEFACCVCSFT